MIALERYVLATRAGVALPPAIVDKDEVRIKTDPAMPSGTAWSLRSACSRTPWAAKRT